ncbi:hypothetical protein [Marinactinospora rubrisoli]|uniref:Molecular chaperone DnaJ n=1 Tax=Marinactinospora rubrisoli TaxID=2715399 RepID=A0ABW2KD01_9ACTN
MGKHSKQVKCSVCGGDGEVVVYHDGSKESFPCQACNGTGWV